MINSISDSGGRTSAYMVALFSTGEYNNGFDNEYLFCDTGAEDNKTYEFLKRCNNKFNLDLVCLEATVSEEMGVSNGYKIKSLDDCEFDMSLMKIVVKKYGGFTINRPWCTDKLKSIILTKYRNETHGKDKYITWIGIRYDEPKRLVGKAYSQLLNQGYDKEEISDLYISAYEDESILQKTLLLDDTIELLISRIKKQKKAGIKYLAQISKFTKQDILDWWKNQEFDLEIDEHLGNCVFCIKKSELKLSLAQRDRPQEFKEWNKAVTSSDVRLMPTDKFGIGHIYRKWLTPEMLIAKFSDSTTEELRERVYKTKQLETGSCSESCEAFGDLDNIDKNQLELFQ